MNTNDDENRSFFDGVVRKNEKVTFYGSQCMSTTIWGNNHPQRLSKFFWSISADKKFTSPIVAYVLNIKIIVRDCSDVRNENQPDKIRYMID